MSDTGSKKQTKERATKRAAKQATKLIDAAGRRPTAKKSIKIARKVLPPMTPLEPTVEVRPALAKKRDPMPKRVR